MVSIWSNEQAIREIYLKPFEISVKQGGANAVMVPGVSLEINGLENAVTL